MSVKKQTFGEVVLNLLPRRLSHTSVVCVLTDNSLHDLNFTIIPISPIACVHTNNVYPHFIMSVKEQISVGRFSNICKETDIGWESLIFTIDRKLKIP